MSSDHSTLPDVFVNKDSSSVFQTINRLPVLPLTWQRQPVFPPMRSAKKIDLINKLNRLETKGYNLTKRFTMDNSIEEIQVEYDRLVDAKNLEASLRFQRQCMMGVVTGAEF